MPRNTIAWGSLAVAGFLLFRKATATPISACSFMGQELRRTKGRSDLFLGTNLRA
ncbi:MAG: hypothetical protein JNK57_11100 [Planctomycetaceae bacterium]|nr:hypothetical protein [Planctomycetaceae bacterium]